MAIAKEITVIAIKRIDYIDVFKAFGIILMIMGHVDFGIWFDVFIHAFHMQMFFFVSGFLYRDDYDLEEYIVRKCKTLLMPYYLFGLIHIAIMYMLKQGDQKHFFALFYTCTSGIPIAEGLWFLMSLFFADVIFFLIQKITEKSTKVIIIAVISLAGMMMRKITGVFSPLGVTQAFVGIGLMSFGKELRKYEARLFCMETWQWLLLSAFSFVLIDLLGVKGYVNMRIELYPYPILFWVEALSCIIWGINFARFLNSKLSGTFLIGWLKSIGKNSIIYVVLNQLLIMVINDALLFSTLSIVIKRMLCLSLTMLALFVVSKIAEKTKLKVLFGRF